MLPCARLGGTRPQDGPLPPDVLLPLLLLRKPLEPSLLSHRLLFLLLRQGQYLLAADLCRPLRVARLYSSLGRFLHLVRLITVYYGKLT